MLIKENSMAILKEKSKAPSFSLLNDENKKISLKDFAGQKVILYFYPKDDTPGCTKEACDFKDSMNKIKKSDAIVVGVSKDSVERHQTFKKKNRLNFSLLADVEGKVCKKYGVWKEKSMYGRKYMGIERSTFILDEKGKILKAYYGVKVPGHVDQVIKELK